MIQMSSVYAILSEFYLVAKNEMALLPQILGLLILKGLYLKVQKEIPFMRY